MNSGIVAGRTAGSHRTVNPATRLTGDNMTVINLIGSGSQAGGAGSNTHRVTSRKGGGGVVEVVEGGVGEVAMVMPGPRDKIWVAVVTQDRKWVREVEKWVKTTWKVPARSGRSKETDNDRGRSKGGGAKTGVTAIKQRADTRTRIGGHGVGGGVERGVTGVGVEGGGKGVGVV